MHSIQDHDHGNDHHEEAEFQQQTAAAITGKRTGLTSRIASDFVCKHGLDPTDVCAAGHEIVGFVIEVGSGVTKHNVSPTSFTPDLDAVQCLAQHWFLQYTISPLFASQSGPAHFFNSTDCKNDCWLCTHLLLG